MSGRDWNSGDDGTEPSLRGVDLADVHAAPRRRRPKWDAPVNSPTFWVAVFTWATVALLVYLALVLSDWIGLR